MSEHKINVTLKASGDYDAPWITIGGDSPNEVKQYLDALSGTGILDATTQLAMLFQGALKVSKGMQPAQPNAVPTPQNNAAVSTAWNNQQAEPQQTQQVQQSSFDGTPDPLNRTCQVCGTVLRGAQSRPGANKQWKAWKCPNAPRGDRSHTVFWVD